MAASAASFKETAWLQESHKAALNCVAFNFFSKGLEDVFASAGSNRATVYRCLPSGQLEVVQVYQDADSSEEFYVCKWSVDERSGAPLLLLAGKNGLLQVVDCATGAVLAAYAGHGQAINDIAVHPRQPHLVATASKDHAIRLWNIRTKVCVLVLSGDGSHRNEVLSLDWSSVDPDLLLSAGLDSQIKIWSIAKHRPTVEASERWDGEASSRAFPTGHVTTPVFSTEKAHFGYVDCVRWLGDIVLSKSVNNRLVAWQPDDSVEASDKAGAVRLIQELTLEECDTVWFVRFALDFQGRSLAVGTKSGRVLVFDPWALSTAPVARLKPRRPLPKSGARFLVRQTALSYDGSILVACHDDGSITRYDRGCAGAASSQQEPSGAAPLLVRGGSGPVGRL